MFRDAKVPMRAPLSDKYIECACQVNSANCNFTVRLESEEWRVEITETYGFRVSYAEFNGIDDKGNGSISLSSLYTLQSPLSRKFQFASLIGKAVNVKSSKEKAFSLLSLFSRSPPGADTPGVGSGMLKWPSVPFPWRPGRYRPSWYTCPAYPAGPSRPSSGRPR